jgi:hypothetical protein
MHRRGPYRGGGHAITGAGARWLFLHKGMIPSARAKNSEIKQEYDDVRYVIDEVTRRQVNGS